MISLYGDGVPREINPKPQTPEPEPTPAPKPEPIVTEAPKEQQEVEQPKRIGDILGSKTTLADQMSKDDAPTTPFGLNDRFLMIRDLFAGDAERFEATIDTINEFDDLDECMIYIVENFKWNPDSEGAKLIVSLIERKLA